MNALVASKAKRNVASRGVMLTEARHRCASACPENAGGEQLHNFLARRAPEFTVIAMSGIGMVFDG